jgi:hypothetical protein
VENSILHFWLADLFVFVVVAPKTASSAASFFFLKILGLDDLKCGAFFFFAVGLEVSVCYKRKVPLGWGSVVVAG